MTSDGSTGAVDHPKAATARLRRQATPVRLVAAGYAALRIVAVVGLSPWRSDTDTPTYLHLDFTGDGRPWFVPLVYEIAGRDEVRVLLQLAIGIAAWLFLAATVAGLFDRWRTAVFAATLAPSLVTHVTAWDTMMLSESLSFSTSVVVVACWVRFVQDPSRRSAVWVMVATVPWVFTHQQHAFAALLVLVVVAGAWWRRRSPVLAALALALAVTSVWAVVASTRYDDANHLNLGAIVHDRIIQDPDRAAWFEARGMPPRPEWAVGARFGTDFDWAHHAVVFGDEEWTDWIARDGRRVYVLWLLQHPVHVVGGPLPALVGDDGDGMLSARAFPDTSRPVVPAVVTSWVVGDGAEFLFVLVVAGGLVAAAWARAGLDRRFVVPLVLLATALPRFWIAWHASPMEHGRHVIVPSMLLRVAVVMLVALSLDRLVDRTSRPDRRASVV